ncbi:MAG: hypothetical protein KAT94_02335 [Candidatus Aenigmarchaeota archaeon]|nr:hypothetical protein [Candidatus Aenigmarchaeota archaeon]
MRKKSGQTSMILIVLAVIIFMAIGAFLLISSIKPKYEEYHNLYAHNLLLCVLRRNTGYGGYCDTISSTIACAYMTSYRGCGATNCRDLSNEIVPNLIERVIKPTFDYCMIIEPEINVTVGETDRIRYGPRCDVVMSKSERWTANEKILQHEANLNIQMVIAET